MVDVMNKYTAKFVYNDRKMMKWMPFNALLEQGDHVGDLLRGRIRISMPTLSADQQDDLNYKLQSAYTFQNEVLVTYYDKNDFHTAQGVIIRTDMYNKLIFIGEEAVSALAITKIEIL